MNNGSGHLALKFTRAGLYPRGSAHVMVQCHIEGANGAILISPECVSYSEVEANVNLLKRDLDLVLAAAKRKFAQAKNLPLPPLFPENSN